MSLRAWALASGATISAAAAACNTAAALMYVWDQVFVTSPACNIYDHFDWRAYPACFTTSWTTPEAAAALVNATHVGNQCNTTNRLLLSGVTTVIGTDLASRACDASIVRVISLAHARNMTVYGLIAVSDEEFSEQLLVDRLVQWNRQCNGTQFDGVAVNNEAYTGLRCTNATREAGILDGLAATAAKARNASMRFHFSMAYYWGWCDLAGGVRNNVTWRGLSKPASQHMLDVIDSADVQVASARASTMASRALAADAAYAASIGKEVYILAYASGAEGDCRLGFLPMPFNNCSDGISKDEVTMWANTWAAADSVATATGGVVRAGVHYYGGPFSTGVAGYPFYGNATWPPSPTPSPSQPASVTPSQSASLSTTPSTSRSPSLTASPTVSVTISASASPAVSPSVSATGSRSASASTSTTPGASASVSVSNTASLTSSVSPGASHTGSSSASCSETVTSSATPAVSSSQSSSASASMSGSRSATVSISLGSSVSSSASTTSAALQSPTCSATASPTASRHPSVSSSATSSVAASMSSSVSLSTSASASPSATATQPSAASASPSVLVLPSVRSSSSASPSSSSAINASPSGRDNDTGAGMEAGSPGIHAAGVPQSTHAIVGGTLAALAVVVCVAVSVYWWQGRHRQRRAALVGGATVVEFGVATSSSSTTKRALRHDTRHASVLTALNGGTASIARRFSGVVEFSNPAQRPSAAAVTASQRIALPPLPNAVQAYRAGDRLATV